MTQSTLFELTPPPTVPPVAEIPRQRQRERAHEQADNVFLERYTALLVSAGRVLGRFVAAEITAEYERRNGAIDEHNARGLGNLYGLLQRQGVIRKTGTTRARRNGNLAAEYSLVN